MFTQYHISSNNAINPGDIIFSYALNTPDGIRTLALHIFFHSLPDLSVTLFYFPRHATTTPSIDLTDDIDGINKNDDYNEEREKNGEDHVSDFGKTQKGRKSATTTRSQNSLPGRQKPKTKSKTAAKRVRTTSLKYLPPHHARKVNLCTLTKMYIWNVIDN